MRGPVLLLSMLLLGVPLQAQSLEPGTPLRVHARGYTVAGDLVRWETDSLVVRPETPSDDAGLRADRAVALSDILSLERAVPRARGWGTARGALWGGAVGGIVGAVVGGLDARDCPCYLIQGEWDGAFWGGVILGGLGAAVGALVGNIAPGQKWERVELEP
jgi:hypothetical protein